MNAVMKPMADYHELLLGCGAARDKRIRWDKVPTDWQNVTTHDIDPDSGADTVHDLDVLPYPWADNSFDEIHAYEVLEHTGSQGDAKFFFAQFAELYRMLKPGGYLACTVPAWDSQVAWCMPDHKRVIAEGSIAILDHRYYADLGKPSGIAKADYRKQLGTTNFQTIAHKIEGDNFGFVLKAMK